MTDRMHGGNIWFYPKNAIDFSANINPLGLPPKVKETIFKNISTLKYYPEPEYRDLKNTISSFHHIRPCNVVLGNGSIELIHLLPRALGSRDALIVGPTFSEYEFAVRSNRTNPFFALALEKDDFKIDMLKIKKFIPKVDLVFLCNPNNPTGFLISKQELLDLFKLCKRYNTILVIDEVFMDFVQNDEKISLVNEVVKHNRFLVIRSLTKFFALAGLRIGYLIGGQDIVEHIARFQYPWNVNLLAQLVAKEVFRDNYYIKLSKRFILEERVFLWENLRKIKRVKVYPPTANFIFCRLESESMRQDIGYRGKIRDTLGLNKNLLKEKIIIRSCHNFRGLDDRFFRIAVRTRSENKRLISCLRKVLW